MAASLGMMQKISSDRFRAALVATVLIPVGIGTKLYDGPGSEWIVGSLGGSIYVMFWVFVVLALRPGSNRTHVAVVVLLATTAIELLQLWHPPLLEGVRRTMIGQALLGGVFSWVDIPFYVAGAIAAFALAIAMRLGRRRHGQARPDLARSSSGKGLCVAAVALLSACGGAGTSPVACTGLDPTLAESSFVLLLEPRAGSRATSPLQVHGCSRTFESNVLWELRGRDGRVLNEGYATGGGVDGAAAFEVSIDFTVSAPEVGQLEVFEEDASGGEGFPPSRAIVAVVLMPGLVR